MLILNKIYILTLLEEQDKNKMKRGTNFEFCGPMLHPAVCFFVNYLHLVRVALQSLTPVLKFAFQEMLCLTHTQTLKEAEYWSPIDKETGFSSIS